MSHPKGRLRLLGLLFVAGIVVAGGFIPSEAQGKKPNILFIVSDDTGYGDLGPYGGGEGRLIII